MKIKSLIKRKEWKSKKQVVVNKLIKLFAAYSDGKFKQYTAMASLAPKFKIIWTKGVKIKLNTLLIFGLKISLRNLSIFSKE